MHVVLLHPLASCVTAPEQMVTYVASRCERHRPRGVPAETLQHIENRRGQDGRTVQETANELMRFRCEARGHAHPECQAHNVHFVISQPMCRSAGQLLVQVAESQGQLLKFRMQFDNRRWSTVARFRDGDLRATFHQRRQGLRHCFPQTVIDIMVEPPPVGFAISHQVFDAAEEKQSGDAARFGARIMKFVETRGRSLQSWPRNSERGVHFHLRIADKTAASVEEMELDESVRIADCRVRRLPFAAPRNLDFIRTAPCAVTRGPPKPALSSRRSWARRAAARRGRDVRGPST